MRYIKNLFFLLISYSLGLFLNFFLLKILTNFLPPENLGIYFAYLGGALIVSQMMLLGFPYVFTRYIPYWEEKGKEERIFSLFFLFILIYIFLTSISLIVLLFLPFSHKGILILSLLTAYFLSFLTILISLFNSFRKMEYSFLINFFYLFLFTSLTYALKENLEIRTVFLLQIISVSAGILMSFIFLLRKFKFTISAFKSVVKEIKSYWKESFLLHILSPFFDYADRLILAFFSSFINVSLFTSMRKIVQPLRQILHYPAEAMAPEISARIEKFGEFKIYFDILRKFLFIFSLHLFLFIFLFGKNLISFITSEFYLSAYPILILLGIKIIISALYSPYLLLYRSYGRMIHFFYSDFLWILFFLSFAYPSVRYMGIEGLALLHVFSSTVVLIFNYIFIIPNYEIISRREFLKVFKYSLSSIFPFFVLFLYRTIPSFFVLITFYILFIILSFIFKPFTKEEITYIKRVLREKWN